MIIAWSGMWPYMKLMMMQFCWFVPTSTLSAEKRLSMLEFLDNWGKWSLIDAFVMVIFMVAFKFNLTTDDVRLQGSTGFFNQAGTSAAVNVYVEAAWGFHIFLLGTV